MPTQMGRFETLTVDNPIREWLARGEMASFAHIAPLPGGADVLEIGCGPGRTTRRLLDRFQPRRLVAFDFDEQQVERARRRLDARPALGFQCASAEALPHRDASFDAVFAIGIMHHVPQWRQAIAEVARTLRPGGLYYFAEPTRWFTANVVFSRLFPHPPGAIFSRDEFLEALAQQRLQLVAPPRRHTLFWELFGAARRIH